MALVGFPDRSFEEKHQQRPDLARFNHLPAVLAQQVEEILELFCRMAGQGSGLVLLGKLPGNEFGTQHAPQAFAGDLGIGGLGRLAAVQVDMDDAVLPLGHGSSCIDTGSG